MGQNSAAWQLHARARRDAIVAAFEAGQTLEEEFRSLVASVEEEHADLLRPMTAEDLRKSRDELAQAWDEEYEEPTISGEEPADPEKFSALVAAWDADYAEEAPHNSHYDVASVTAAHAARGAVQVSTWRTERLPDDVPGLLAALDARDRAPGGLVAAVQAREQVGPTATDLRAERLAAEARARQVEARSRAGALVASGGPSARPVFTANHPVAWARRADRLQALLRRGDPHGTGSSAPLRSTITASAALPNAPDGTVLSWNDQRLNAQRRRSRLDELLGRSAVPS